MTDSVLYLKDYCINKLINLDINIFKYQFVNNEIYNTILYNRKYNEFNKYNKIIKDDLSKYVRLTTWTRGKDFDYYFIQYRIRYHTINNKRVLIKIKKHSNLYG